MNGIQIPTVHVFFTARRIDADYTTAHSNKNKMGDWEQLPQHV